MPQKTKTYNGIIFPPDIIRSAAAKVKKASARWSIGNTYRHLSITATSGEIITYDKEEEFFVNYAQPFKNATFEKRFFPYFWGGTNEISVGIHGDDTKISVAMPKREDIETIFSTFDAQASTSKLPLSESKSDANSLEKDKKYKGIRFKPEVIQQALSEFDKSATNQGGTPLWFPNLSITLESGESWKHNNLDEFFADYRKGFSHARLSKSINYGKYSLKIWVYEDISSVAVSMPDRATIERIFSIFESHLAECTLPTPVATLQEKVSVKVFIGHGHNPLWKELKDHLHEFHGLDVDAYEIGARAGLTVKEVLNEMLTKNSFALLVFTGEDVDDKGQSRARENVIHELGLFQGHLGWARAIVLLEDGVQEFSNIVGITQIRFQRGNIRETFGEVLATINREFPEKRQSRS